MSVDPPVLHTGGRWIIGFLIVLGGVILFYAGILLGRQQTATEQPEKRAPGIAQTSIKHRVRKVFSPTVIADPYILDEQHKVVEALERACAHQRQNCETARKARAYIDAHR